MDAPRLAAAFALAQGPGCDKSGGRPVAAGLGAGLLKHTHPLMPPPLRSVGLGGTSTGHIHRQNFLEQIGATCLFTAARYRSAAEKAQILHIRLDGMRHGQSEIAQVARIGGRMGARSCRSFLRAHLGTAGRREWASRRELSHGGA